jgi:hypothetical protein
MNINIKMDLMVQMKLEVSLGYTVIMLEGYEYNKNYTLEFMHI